MGKVDNLEKPCVVKASYETLVIVRNTQVSGIIKVRQ